MTFVRETMEKTLQKADEWIEDLEQEMGTDDGQWALAALRAVLHVLRDRLPLEEVAQLSAQLPVLVRGFFFEGWDPTGKPDKIRSREAFIERVEDELAEHPDVDAEIAILAVFNVLRRKISEGEFEEVRQNLGRRLDEFLPRE